MKRFKDFSITRKLQIGFADAGTVQAIQRD